MGLPALAGVPHGHDGLHRDRMLPPGAATVNGAMVPSGLMPRHEIRAARSGSIAGLTRLALMVHVDRPERDRLTVASATRPVEQQHRAAANRRARLSP